MISKTISTSRKVSRLSERAALVYTWVIPHTDDYGHIEGDALSIKAKVVPMLPITAEQVQEVIAELVKNGLIRLYDADGERYLEIIGFDRYQTFKNDRPRTALYPKDALGIQRNPAESEWKKRPAKLREGKGREGKMKNAAVAAPLPSKPRKPESNPDDPFTLAEYIASMRQSPLRHIRLIGEYADQISPDLKTKGQWTVFTKRHVRAAKALEVFSDEQIERAMGRIEKDCRSKKNPRGFITNWGLETLLKYVTK